MNKSNRCLAGALLLLLCTARAASLQEMALAPLPVPTAAAPATADAPGHEGTDLEQSPLPGPAAEQALPYSFLLFAPQRPVTGGSYEERVLAAVTDDLANRLGGEEGITVVRSGVVEVPLALPCPSALVEEEGPVADGIGRGYEVILAVGATVHRYVAVGGTGHYCGVVGG